MRARRFAAPLIRALGDTTITENLAAIDEPDAVDKRLSNRSKTA
jgi:hypothetical protein